MHREHEHCESEADEKAREEAEEMARIEAHAAPYPNCSMPGRCRGYCLRDPNCGD